MAIINDSDCLWIWLSHLSIASSTDPKSHREFTISVVQVNFQQWISIYFLLIWIIWSLNHMIRSDLWDNVCWMQVSWSLYHWQIVSAQDADFQDEILYQACARTRACVHSCVRPYSLGVFFGYYIHMLGRFLIKSMCMVMNVLGWHCPNATSKWTTQTQALSQRLKDSEHQRSLRPGPFGNCIWGFIL